jgi:hypothetical protein
MIHHDINGAYVEDNEFKDHEDTTALNEEMKIPVRPQKKTATALVLIDDRGGVGRNG